MLTSFNDIIDHITLLKTELENLLALRKNEAFEECALTSRVNLHNENRSEQSKTDVQTRYLALRLYHSKNVVGKYAREAADVEHRTELDRQLEQLTKEGKNKAMIYK